MSHRSTPHALLLAAAMLAAWGAPPSLPAVDEQAPAARPSSGRDVYLSTSEGLARWKVAIPAALADPGLGKAAERLMDVTRNDLHFTGRFRIVDPSLYDLVLRDVREGEAPEVTARRWQSIGAEYLVRARLSGDAEELVLEAYLQDLISGDEVMGKRYRSSPEMERLMAHHLAEDLLAYFTGRGSIFTTHLVYTSRRGDAQEVFVSDYDGANERAVTSNGSLNLSPAVSPDGTVVAYTSYETGKPAIHMADLSSGRSRLLYETEGTCQSPAWAPDGEHLAFASSEEGNSDIFVLARDGSNPERLTRGAAIDVSPVWSPTGREIAFVSDRAGRPQIYVMDRYGTNVRRLTYETEQATDPAWSPEGDRIAFTGRIDGRLRICTIDLARNLEECLEPTGVSDEAPAWSPDGRYLAYLSNRGGTTTLHLRSADGQGESWPVFLRGSPRTPAWYR